MIDILNDSGFRTDAAGSKIWQFRRQLAMIRKLPQILRGFATELSNINLAFWNRPPANLRKRVYLTTVAGVAMLFARSAFAASADVLHAPGACFFVICGAWIASGLGFAADPRYRKFASRFSPSCYRVIITLVILSTTVIATNLAVQWSAWISAFFGFTSDGFKEKAIAVALPASLLAFSFLFSTSFLDPRFRRSWHEERVRVIGWSAYLFSFSFMLTLGVFVDVVISEGVFGVFRLYSN